MQLSRFSLSNVSLKHRLPLLIGTLLSAIILASTWASYRGVKESALEVGADRLESLTKQLANLLQQSNALQLTKTFTAANDPAIRTFLKSPSPATRSGASGILEQFASAQDPLGLQVELWDTNHSLVLILPDGASPEPVDLEAEFKAASVDPFKASGPMYDLNGTISVPAVVAVKDDDGKPIGYLVRWRRASISPAPKQLTDLIGSDSTLYFGNNRGDLFTNLERAVPKPQPDLGLTSEVMHYSRDGNSVMALARPIGGTPWFLLVEFPEQPFLAQANRFLQRIVIIDLFLFAIGIAAAFALSRGITRPLHSLTDAAAAITGGDYSRTVDVKQTDELGLLAAGFNTMTDKVRTSQSELEKNVQALGESEQRLQTVIENLSEGVIVSDLNGQLLNWNRAALEIHGFASLDECLLKLPEFANIFELSDLTGAVLDIAQWPLPRIIRGETLRNVEVRIRRLNSEWSRVFNYGGSIVREASGKLAAVVTMSDITERKRAEERFRLVVEASPSAMIMVNDRGLISLVNTQTEQLFGYTRTELLGTRMKMLVPERYRATHPDLRAAFFEHPSARAMGAGRNLFGLRKDGVEVPIEIGLNPIQTDEGAFVLASIIDITERKRDEERIRLVVEASPNAMIMANNQGEITLVNKQVENLFGYTRNELLRQPIEILVPERYRASHPGHRQSFFSSPSTRAMGAGRDLFGLRKDGTEVSIEIGLNPIRTEEGSFVLASIVDITGRKHAEEEMRRSREQLAGVIGSAMDAIISTDEQQRIVLFNNAAERMFLFPAEDAIGQPLDRFIPERFRAAHQKHVERFGQTHATQRSMGALGALYGLRADGAEFPIEASISQIESGDQKLFTVILRDISERKRAEEVHREQAGILDLAPILIRDLSDRIVFWNAGAEQMFGWKADEALDKVSHTLLHTEFPRPLEEIKARVLAHGHWEGELVHVRKNGERIVVASRWVLHRDKQGKPKAILAVNNDVTEHRRLEEAERSSELRYRRLFESAKDGILILDGNTGHIVDVNPYLLQLLGFSKEEIVGKELWQLGFFEDIDASKLAFTELKARGYIRYENLPLKNRDGLVMMVEFVSNSYMAGARRVIQCNIRDITERTRAEERIRGLNEELEERVADRTAELQTANRELEAFSYSVSHDLRAPLRHINGFSQALLEDYEDKLDEAGKGYLREVRGASQEMAQLIDDVLQLARVTRSEMRREEVDLSDLARTVAADLKKRNGRQGVTVKIEEGLAARGDKRLLRIVLTNLLDNAWKFTSKQDRAEILFGREQKNGEVFYFVRDNGAGFEMAYASKLFGAFQRLHTAGEFEGTGIGLATVQRIVHRHGGRVRAEGKLTEGATFYFSLSNSKETGDGQQSDLTS